ncbi:alpha,alpha-trehalose-phosphate synthase (UDP-forming) [Mesorhizobium sp. CAU 1732]|uniref:alpha,alpha-trehalose-phosphate synthase (UDP-forming) n=1 Tax=Mesorhizobium sp. CAU 1732 TaxID=3140358 RepID=UPI00325FF80B
MSRLVVVSNRVADLRKSSQSGGLAVGLADALRERGGVWFGWDGETVATRPTEAKVDEIGNVRMISMPIRQEDYNDYYIGYANSVLWPLFHYRLDLVSFRPAFFEGYMRVNLQFASLLAPHLADDDIVWVHDYHLIPLAQALRNLGCRQRTGFFLHIPFPPLDLLAATPNHRELVEALMQYDVIGFQTSTDVANFRHYLDEWGMAESVDEDTVRVDRRLITIRRYPIGVDADAFREMAEQTPDDVRIDSQRREVLGRKQIIGVDRLDYSKGLPDRFRAFSRLLSLHPELEKKVTFLQVAPPTREDVNAYSDIREELEGLTGSINGRFSDFNWTPLRYIHRPVARETLASLFRASRVGLVTPLRDGMNLVAKEFVAAQDDENPGVLVLSQFAGAAEELREALIVNPYDIDGMAEAINRALYMDLDERKDRQKALRARVSEQNAQTWLESFLRDLERPGKPVLVRDIDASAA